MIAHDMRSPLMAILGALDMLEGEAVPEARQRRMIAAARRSARRLESLARELCELSHAGSGRLTLELAEHDLAGAIRRAVTEASLWPEHDGKAILPFAAEPVRVRADGQRVGRALQNVLTNALRHARSAVVVTLCRNGSEACIAVEDDGPGIPDELMPTIFEPFVRNGDGGAGLGLAITREIVRALGGRVMAANRLDEDGARFELWLPTLPSNGG